MSRLTWNTNAVACAKALAGYLFAAAVSLLGVAYALRLWRADFRVPFSYEGDAVQTLAWVKGLLDNPWYFHNQYVGMPTGQEMYDFPLVFVDSFQFLLMKLLGLAFPDYAIVGNLYFILTFPLSTLTALFVMRRLGASYWPSLVASVLFAFLPYHFLRGQMHLFLASYYMVPLAVLVALWLYLEPETFTRWTRWLPASLICLVIASAGVYYAYFTCFFFLVAGPAAAFRARRFRPAVPALVMTGVVCVGVAANLLPALAYRLEHGPNPEAVVRNWAEAETFGLKVSQLLLPGPNHRVKAMAELHHNYHRSLIPLLVNENTCAALGVTGAIGFLFLVGRLLWARPGHGEPNAFDGLCTMNLAAVLLGTTSGFGSLVALFGCSWIRGYNRVSVFIGFFALAAVALLLAELIKRLPATRLARGGVLAGLALLLVLGVLDQTTAGFIPRHAEMKEVYSRDGAFVRAIEAAAPPGAMIFQLPYVPFVEHGPPHRMLHYDHCRPYLHSKSLRWSYGAMKGRSGDNWQRWATSQPMPEFLQTLALAGFSGVTVDRHGFADSEVERKVSAELGAPTHESADKRHAYYSLAGHLEKVRRMYPESEFESRRHEARHPLQVSWRGTFSPQEGTTLDYWRWCGRDGEATVFNPGPDPRQYELSMACRYWHPNPVRLILGGDLLDEELMIDPNTPLLRRTLTVPPGTHHITFLCAGEQLPAPNDPRPLMFRVVGFSMRRVDWTRHAMAR